ncbi:MAG: DUF2911 domain-containing protein [Acidobacteriales bacterium]|nr:DUF2911 domain-containing protein [Terriglobales bacterium]
MTAAFLLIGSNLEAQFQNGNQSVLLNLPLLSQQARVSQRIGITDITITYHRPLVNGRKIWGTVVPFGQVWRAGADENTVIEFTNAVSIEGKELPKGTYGLHMIPGENQWTIIFSKNSTSWGSFTYNPAEDALRVTVKPQADEFHEALMYEFDDLKADSATINLRWEKIRVPFRVAVNVNEIVEHSLPNQLRGYAQYTWEGYDDAATWLLEFKGNLDQALKYADLSIQNEERYDNLMTKSRILEAQGKKQEAAAVRERALQKATVLQMHFYARQLQQQGKQEEAFAVYRENAKKNPTEWVVHTGLARVYSAQHDFPAAAREMRLAVAGAPEAQKAYLEGLAKRLDAKDDINK